MTRVSAPLITAAVVLTLAACSREGRPPSSDDAPATSSTDGASIRIDGDGVSTPTEAPSQTQCAQGQRALYNCAFADGKVMSICAGGPGMAYHYGPLGRPELSLVVAPGRDGVWKGQAMAPGSNFRTHIRFHEDGYDYVVYNRWVETPAQDPPPSSGVTVFEGGREIHHLRCPVANYQTEIAYAMIPDDVPVEPDDRFIVW